MKSRFVGVLKRGEEEFFVRLFPLIKEKSLHGSYYHKGCGGEIGYQWFCKTHGVVSFEEVERGFSVKDRVVYLTEKEKASLRPSFPKGEIHVLFEQSFDFPPIFKDIYMVVPARDKKLTSGASYLGYLEYLRKKKLVSIVTLILTVGRKSKKVFGCIYPQFLFSQYVLLLGVLPFRQELIEISQINEIFPSAEEAAVSLEEKRIASKVGKNLLRKGAGWPLFPDEEQEKLEKILEAKINKERKE